MTSGRRHLVRRTGCATLLLLVVALAACGDDDAPSADGSASASTSAATESSEAPETESTASGSPTATVAPASGPRLQLEHTAVSAPAGWTVTSELTYFAQADDPDPASVNSVFLGDAPDTSGGDLERMAQSVIESWDYPLPPTRQPDTTLGGVPAYLFSGKVDKDTTLYQYGATGSGAAIEFLIALDVDMPADQQQAMVASVLASFEWR